MLQLHWYLGKGWEWHSLSLSFSSNQCTQVRINLHHYSRTSSQLNLQKYIIIIHVLGSSFCVYIDHLLPKIYLSSIKNSIGEVFFKQIP